jgi:hypothetical protein
LSSGSLLANATKMRARRTIGACMEDKCVVSTQQIVPAFRPPGPQSLALPRMDMTPSQRYLSTRAGLEGSTRPLTAAEREFREGQVAGQRLVARGVKCHVSCDMARYGNAWALGCFNKREHFGPIASRSLRSALVGIRLHEWNCSCSN